MSDQFVTFEKTKTQQQLGPNAQKKVAKSE